MNKETLGLIFLIGVAGLVILAFVLNDAYGVHEPSGWLDIQETCFERTGYTQHFISSIDGKPYDKDGVTFDWCIEGLLIDIHETQFANLGYLNEILKEEQKQTALLDQSNCFAYYEYTGGYSRTYNSKAHKEFCGEPLNLTGVWTP